MGEEDARGAPAVAETPRVRCCLLPLLAVAHLEAPGGAERLDEDGDGRGGEAHANQPELDVLLHGGSPPGRGSHPCEPFALRIGCPVRNLEERESDIGPASSALKSGAAGSRCA